MTAVAVRASGRSLGWWGVVFLIITEGMIFALLLFAYFFVWANSATWPLDGIPGPELVQSGIRSAVLIGSSIPVHLAHKAIERGNRRGLCWGLFAGIVMALVFFAGHVEEYAVSWKEFTFADNAYGSLFYGITGLHALHLLAGIAVATYVLVLAVQGHFSEHDYEAVENTSMYWHFVDVVWIAVFSSLYLAVGWA